MKILFVNPPTGEDIYSSPPLGIAYLASVLRKEHEVDIVDCGIEGIDALKRKIRNLSPDAVGVTAMTPNIQQAINTVMLVRKEIPETKIIAGGPHFSIMPEETLKNIKEIDVIVRGEGEGTCQELFAKLQEKGKLENVKGISFRGESGTIHNAGRPLIKNLDRIPFPARDLLPLKRYRQSISRKKYFTTMMTTRGCPFNCLYCVKCIFGRDYRSRSPENIMEEIEEIVNIHKIREIIFYDDTFTLQKDRIMKLCNLIMNSRLDISWKCETRVDLVDRELLNKMRKSGCYLIAYGVESGNPGLLKIVRKGVTKDQIRKAFRLTREAGIETIAYFMFGIPGETRETMKQTTDFAFELDPDYAQFSITTPLPGTDLYNMALKNGMLSEGEWSRFSYLGKKSYPLIRLENLGPGELVKARSRAMRKFYLRPKYVFKKMKESANPLALKRNVLALKTLITNF